MTMARETSLPRFSSHHLRGPTLSREIDQVPPGATRLSAIRARGDERRADLIAKLQGLDASARANVLATEVQKHPELAVFVVDERPGPFSTAYPTVFERASAEDFAPHLAAEFVASLEGKSQIDPEEALAEMGRIFGRRFAEALSHRLTKEPPSTRRLLKEAHGRTPGHGSRLSTL